LTPGSLAYIAENSRRCTASKDVFVLKEVGNVENIYFVFEGKLLKFKTVSQTNVRMILATGSHFGELAFLGNIESSWTYQAATRGIYLVLRREVFDIVVARTFSDDDAPNYVETFISKMGKDSI